MGAIAAALGGIGSIIGAVDQGNASKADAAAAQTAANNQSKVDNQLIQMAQGLQNTNAQYYQPSLSGTAGAYNAESTGAAQQAPDMMTQLLKLLSNPQAQAQLTGVNANQLAQNATSYASNPGATNLAQVSPALMQYYAGVAQNGISPQYAQNAQNQLTQGFDTSLDDIMSNLAPGQNPNTLMRSAQDSLLSNQTNLAGNLAGQSQQLSLEGAQGLSATAGGLDAQTLNMLSQALSMGSGYNQTQLGNVGAGATAGQDLLSQLAGFSMGGNQLTTDAMSTLGGLGQQYGQQASGLANAAQQTSSANPFSALGTSLSNYLGTQSTTSAGGVGLTAPEQQAATNYGLDYITSLTPALTY